MIIEHDDLIKVTEKHLESCDKMLKNSDKFKAFDTITCCLGIDCIEECPFYDDNIKNNKRCDYVGFDMVKSAKLLIEQGLKEK